MTNTVLLTIGFLSILSLLISFLLYWVSQKFKVVEDPRIDEVEKCLPGANCGGCGHVGCRAFAEACVKAPNLDSLYCPVGRAAAMQDVASKLGFTVTDKLPMVAVVRCAGSCESRPRTNIYDGVKSCKVMNALYTGETGCKYGCLGQGDCAVVCSFDAIHINPVTGLPEVDEEKCTACGACVKACPKFIIELRNLGPKMRRVFVSCINKEKGGVAKKACSVACIGCSKCQKVCTFDAITIENNLSYIDFNKCKLCKKCVEVCPTNAIQTVNFPVKPPVAPKAESEDPKPAVEPAVEAASSAVSNENKPVEESVKE